MLTVPEPIAHALLLKVIGPVGPLFVGVLLQAVTRAASNPPAAIPIPPRRPPGRWYDFAFTQYLRHTQPSR
jgi:hypothetical protein